MNKIIILLLFYFAFGHLLSQNKGYNVFSRKNNIQIEAGGHGLFYSANFERFLFNKPKHKTAIQVGISYYPPKTGIRDIWLPVIINHLFSFKNNHLELGAGYNFIREAGRDYYNNTTTWYWSGMFIGRLGYRYQNPEKRMLFRVGFTPFAEKLGNGYEFYPSGGVSVGYSF